MSKRTRYKDNSKRSQPVQQQRAQAAQQALSQKNLARSGDRQEAQQRKSGQGER